MPKSTWTSTPTKLATKPNTATGSTMLGRGRVASPRSASRLKVVPSSISLHLSLSLYLDIYLCTSLSTSLYISLHLSTSLSLSLSLSSSRRAGAAIRPLPGDRSSWDLPPSDWARVSLHRLRDLLMPQAGALRGASRVCLPFRRPRFFDLVLWSRDPCLFLAVTMVKAT